MKTTSQLKKRSAATISALLMALLFGFVNCCYAWDYGNGRHGTYVLTSSTTIEQLYQTVRLSSDPAQYNPFDSNAIPNFQNLIITNGATLTANSWNGSTGGRIVLKVQATLSVAAGSAISVSGIGYRGGSSYQQGESYAGGQSTSTSANYGGGGGGSTSGNGDGGTYYIPGGGGGYGSSGANGLWGVSGFTYNGGLGGSTYGTPTLDTNYLGSAGGGGVGSSGGNGGGAIEIEAGQLLVGGQIQANGNGGGTYYYGDGGGGGSGGSILLRVASAVLGTNNVAASGGGASQGGGNGGVGRIMVGYAENFSGVTTPSAYTLLDTNSDNVTVITNQPAAQISFLGSNVVFSVGATGFPPLFFQWNFNNVLIPNATNQTLSLFNLDFTNQGNYSVAISNVVETVVSSNAYLTVLDPRDPWGDGIPNWWKTQYGLSLTDPTLATNYPSGDKLTYLEKYLYGLNPLTNDTDGDGISDYDEIFVYHTNPTNAYTAGDGIPDGWKIEYGLNPLIADANNVAGFDGVTYLQVYQYDLAHTNQLNPNTPFAAGSGLSNYELINNGQHTNNFYYDHEDRLLGMESSRGISIGYQYDGNGNLIHQAVLSRAGETNGLPALWLWLNGLTNEPGIAYADPDGDGWTDYQEWLAGSNPTNASSTPSLLGNPGTNIASLTLPFTPSNFVVGVGNLDGLPGDEIVVGADGNPGTNDNCLFVLTQTATNWSTQQISVGSFGITSIAVGQPTNRPSAGIYIGLRQVGGVGQIMELINVNGAWQTNIVAVSTNEAAFVLGVRRQDVLISLATTNTPDGSLSSVSFVTNWNLSLLDTSASHRGLGIVGNIEDGNLAAIVGQDQSAFRLLDSGGIQVDSPVSEFISEPVSTNRYLWRGTSLTLGTPRLLQTNASSLIYTFVDDNDNNEQISAGDNFVLSEYPNLLYYDPNGFYDNFPGTSLNRTYWANIVGNVVVSSNKVTLTGANTGTGMDTSKYFNMTPGETVIFSGANIPSTTLSYPGLGSGPGFGTGWNQGQTIINAFDGDSSYHSTGVSASSPATLHEFKIVWNSNGKADYFIDGNKVYTGTIAFPMTSSPLHLGVYDAGEVMQCSGIYCYSTTNATSFQTNSAYQLETLSRSSITSKNPAQSYGVASIDILNNGKDVIFTGEPDGQVFAWTATNSIAPLQRNLFSADYTGKAWHALSAVNMPAGGQGLAGLMVDPTNQNTCNVIFWPPESVLSSPQTGVVETAPSAAVLPSANPLGSNAVVTVRLWDNEGDASTPFLQYQFLGDMNWQNATLTALDGALYNPAVRVTALPSGSDHLVIWNALADIGGNVVTNVLLRARAQDFMLMGDWSMPTPFQLNTTITTSANPTNYPVNFTGIISVHGGIQFNWQSSTDAWLYLQHSPALAGTNAVWVNIWTSAPPTLNFGSYTDFFGTNPMGFYRIKSVSP